jgi:hypothetical protein
MRLARAAFADQNYRVMYPLSASSRIFAAGICGARANSNSSSVFVRGSLASCTGAQ